MRRGRRLYALAAVLLAGLGLLACEQTNPEDEKAAAAAAEWAWLEETKAALDAKRDELAELQERIADYDTDAEPEAGGEATGEGEGEGEAAEAPPTLEELTAQAEELQQEVYKVGDEFGQRLAQFINDQQIGVDSELTPVQRQALDMKADEDILLAREYIDKGGEYQRAIDIYGQSLVFDPDNERLLAAKTEAEELQYMTEERFSQVEKDMTEREVQKTLGTPKASNVRKYEETGVTAWFYPREGRAAAGVFFKESKGKLKVYKTDFDAVQPGSDDES